ncbi:MAG TPA: hypothetical protein VIV12_26255 [Streptosporangiaceae bacterium]
MDSSGDQLWILKAVRDIPASNWHETVHRLWTQETIVGQTRVRLE